MKVYTLYGPLTRDLSPEMQAATPAPERLGIRYLAAAWGDMLYWWQRQRQGCKWLVKTVWAGRWRHLEREGESLWGVLCGARLARRFIEEKVTHIHAPWACGPATAAWVASHLTGIPFSFTGRAHDIFTPDSLLAAKIRDAAFVRCESRAVFRHLQELAGGDSSKLRLTYNGVPLTAAGRAPVLMQPPYRLLALGRLVGIKGFAFLIEACRLLKEAGVDFHLTVAGAGAQGWRLRRLTRKLGLASQVSFPGFIPYDRVSGLFQGTDVFIMPSIVLNSGNRDGLPTVILEALLHGVPVVATDVAGIGEVIEPGVTGLLVPPKDPQALAAAVMQQLRNRDAALEMAAQGRARVLRDFEAERNHRRVWQLFQEAGHS
ncbi:MAG: glycosyltransferase family 4 protein [Desulfuromonadaceae bacterium]